MFSQSGNDSKWFSKKIIFQNRYGELETPPPLHGKKHLKFPFWLLAPLPKTVTLTRLSSYYLRLTLRRWIDQNVSKGKGRPKILHLYTTKVSSDNCTGVGKGLIFASNSKRPKLGFSQRSSSGVCAQVKGEKPKWEVLGTLLHLSFKPFLGHHTAANT